MGYDQQAPIEQGSRLKPRGVDEGGRQPQADRRRKCLMPVPLSQRGTGL